MNINVSSHLRSVFVLFRVTDRKDERDRMDTTDETNRKKSSTDMSDAQHPMMIARDETEEKADVGVVRWVIRNILIKLKNHKIAMLFFIKYNQ